MLDDIDDDEEDKYDESGPSKSNRRKKRDGEKKSELLKGFCNTQQLLNFREERRHLRFLDAQSHVLGEDL